MEPEQVRAARNWLGWTQQDLATRAGVGLSTVKSLESGQRQTIRANAAAIRAALEAVGIEFLSNGIKGPLGADQSADAQSET